MLFNYVVRELEPLLRYLLGEHIRIVTDLVADRGQVGISVAQAQQIVLNLSLNARDAMPCGGTLRFETCFPEFEGTGRSDRIFEFAVTDTGDGRDAQTASRIFDAFFTTKPHGRGAGMGLATVRRIVEDAGGIICLDTSPGKGTRMMVRLPEIEDTTNKAVSLDRLSASKNQALKPEVLPYDGCNRSKAAHSLHPVLIVGESVTGKEMVARAIHYSGPFRDKPERELFGYVKDAFTGAVQSKEGLLAIAEGGTVFLDEVGELPVDLQAKMLRALQEKEIRPVGGTKQIPINVRILSATNRDLEHAVAEGAFRRDLYFRLNVLSLRIPPLRERRQDIPMLAAHVLERLTHSSGREIELSDDAMKALLAYDWPGNVRELENSIERCCVMTSRPMVHTLDLPSSITGAPVQLVPRAQELRIIPMADLEKQTILSAIAQLNGDQLLAAKLLGIGKTTLYRKLKEYGAARDRIRRVFSNSAHSKVRLAVIFQSLTVWHRACDSKRMILIIWSSDRAKTAPFPSNTICRYPCSSHPACTKAATDCGQGEYSAVIIDQWIADAEPEPAAVLFDHLGMAIPLFVNFGISGVERIIRELRAALSRRSYETVLARHSARQGLRDELKDDETALLLSSGVALKQPDLSEALTARLRGIEDLAERIRNKLAISDNQHAAAASS